MGIISQNGSQIRKRGLNWEVQGCEAKLDMPMMALAVLEKNDDASRYALIQ